MSAFRDILHQVGALFRWWVTIAPWEQAVRVRLGKHVVVLHAGVHLKVPVVDRVFRQSTRRRFISLATQTVTSTDGVTYTISAVLGYRIDDIGKLYDSLHDAAEAIQSEALAVVANYVASRPSDDVRPGRIEEHVAATLDLVRYGLGGTEFAITDFAAPRTYRFILGQPKDWSDGVEQLNTIREHGVTPP